MHVLQLAILENEIVSLATSTQMSQMHFRKRIRVHFI